MHVVTLADGRNCFGNQIERPSDTIHINDPNQLSGPGEQGGPGCRSGPGCQGGQSGQSGQSGQGGQGSQGSQTNYIAEPPRPRSRCCPYDFDSKLCQVINDRLLCGYNRNVGNPASNDRAIHLNGGCRMRGGRLECGYEHGPFTNARRPPGWDEAHHGEPEENYIVVGDKNSPIQQSSEDIDELDDRQPVVLNNNEPDKEQLKLTILPHKIMHKDSTKKHRSSTKCVEIRDRVVCKKI